MPFFSPYDSGLYPLVTLLLALGLDVLFGEMPRLFRVVPHPVVLIGRVIGFLDAKLNRPERTEADRRLRGVLTVAVVVGGAGGLGWLVEEGASGVPFLWPVVLLLIVALVAQRSLYDHVKAVRAALKTGSLDDGRAAVAHIVGRAPDRLDRHGVARAAIESLAENFSDGVVAPVFWYVLFGLPGLLAYKAVNTLDSMIGYKTEKHRAFGWAAARLDDLANLIPARLAAVMIAAVGFGRVDRVLSVMAADAKHHASPNAGWPEAAMAATLGLKLGGPRVYPGRVVDEPWLGRGTEKAEHGDIARALTILIRACVLQAGLVGLIALAQAG